MNKTIIVLSVFCLFLIGCTKEKDVDSRSNISYSENNGWTVPLDQLVLSSNPPDRIVSIDHPIFVPTSNSELSHDERVFILRVGDSHPDKSIVFSAVQASLPIVFADSKGNFYDMTAYILAGPSRGSRLSSPLSYSAYQFAWDLFYTNHYNIFIE